MEIKPISGIVNNQQSFYLPETNLNSINNLTNEKSAQKVEKADENQSKPSTSKNSRFTSISKRESLPDDEKWKYDLVNLLLKRAIYVPPKSFYSRFELFI